MTKNCIIYAITIDDEMINLLPFYEETDVVLNDEINSYFAKQFFHNADLTTITIDDLIHAFSQKNLINECKEQFEITSGEFFAYVINFLKENIDLRKMTRNRKKINELKAIVNDID